MRQLFLKKPLDLSLRELPEPEPGPGEVTVAMRAALTCGTDLKFYRRGHPRWPLPSPFGHEFSGDVLRVGAGVTGLAPGDPVMLAPSAPCGECRECRLGLSNLCAHCMEIMLLGAFADVVRVPAPIVGVNLYPKPDSLSYLQAALLEPLSCVVYGMEVLGPVRGATVAVAGAGPIGLLYAWLALRQGAARVVVVGRRELRLQAARRLGAEVVEEGEQDLAEAVLAATGGRGAEVVVECTGLPQVWELSVRALARGGRLLFYGGCPRGSQVALPLERLVADGLRLLGAFHFTPQSVARARDLLVSGDAPTGELITEVLPLQEFRRAFRLLEEGRAIKLGITP